MARVEIGVDLLDGVASQDGRHSDETLKVLVLALVAKDRRQGVPAAQDEP